MATKFAEIANKGTAASEHNQKKPVTKYSTRLGSVSGITAKRKQHQEQLDEHSAAEA